MVTLTEIEQQLISALKSRNALEADTLRALKTRIQNEKISKGTDLTEEDYLSLVKSEVKRRKDAAEVYTNGSRPELAEKEKKEIEVLMKFLPAQVSEEEISAFIEKIVSENSFATGDFGKAMSLLKVHFGAGADGSVLSKILKEKLTK